VLALRAGVTEDGKPNTEATSGLLTALFGSIRLFRDTMVKEIFRLGPHSKDDTYNKNADILGRWVSRIGIVLHNNTIKKDLFKTHTQSLQAIDIPGPNKKRLLGIAKATHTLDTLCEKSNKDFSLDFCLNAMRKVQLARETFVSDMSVVTQSSC